MCGLVGMAGNLNGGHVKIFRDMLIFNQVRGFDSTGVLKVNLQGKTEIEKDVSTPNNLWDFEGLSNIFTIRGEHKGQLPKVLLGHNRAATMGEVTVEKAHPFEYGSIIGAHNGTIYDTGDLEDIKKEDLIDSQQVFLDISKHGIEKTWSKIRGAAALTWWDKERDTLNFIRNSQRPLCFLYNEKEDVLLWSSESNFAVTAGARNKFSFGRDKDKNLKIFELEPNIHYCFKVKSSGYELEATKKLTPFSYQTNQNCGRNYTGYTGRTWGVGNKKGVLNNKNWTRGSLKDKNVGTKGLKFTIKATGSAEKAGKRLEYAIGKVLEGPHKDKSIRIFPSSYKALQFLQGFLGKGDVFQTNSKCRIFINDGVSRMTYFGIDFANVRKLTKSQPKEKPVVEDVPANVVMGPDKKEAEVIEILPYLGSNVSEDRWKAGMEKVNYCCTGCNNPLDKNDAPNLKWYNAKVVLCEVCQEDDYITAMIGGV